MIPLTGAFFSGSPNPYAKNYLNIVSGNYASGGFFTTIYDGSPVSVSASALVDLTFGASSASQALVGAAIEVNEKQRVYQIMAQRLLGSNNQLFTFNNTAYNECFFMLFKRRIFKDEIQKGSVSITLSVTGSASDMVTLTDVGAAGNYNTTPGGDQGPLYSGSTVIGSVYYNAGIVVFPTGVFLSPTSAQSVYWSGSRTINQMMSGNIDQNVDGFRNRISQVNFQNQTNLHSTVYFCRALNAEFNYSTNPTFVDSSNRIVPTSGSDNQTRAYITTIGMYDVNDQLLAVGKLSQPVKKSPDSEVVVKCRLSY